MCTLVALHRSIPGSILVVAANRDEFLDRPGEVPALRATSSGPIVAPLDALGGGTWFGVNPAGVFAALTNVACPTPDPELRSRGLLVVDVLAARNAREATEKIASLPMGVHNPFSLFVADAEHAAAFTCEDSVRPVAEPGGVWIVGNAPLDAPEPPKLGRLRGRVGRVASGSTEDVLPGLAAICCDHDLGARSPLDALCVHTPSYGTRSSFLLRITADLENSRNVFRYAEGAPCETEYEDFTFLLRDLGRGCPGVQGAPRTRSRC